MGKMLSSKSAVTSIFIVLVYRLISLLYGVVFLRVCDGILFQIHGVLVPTTRRNLLTCELPVGYCAFPVKGKCPETFCYGNSGDIRLCLSVGSSELVYDDEAEPSQKNNKEVRTFFRGSQFSEESNNNPSSFTPNPSVLSENLIRQYRGGANGVDNHGSYSNNHREQDFTQAHQQHANNPLPPHEEVPLRFIRAGKGDPVEGKRRYDQTLAWRRKHNIDHIIKMPHPNFFLIKQHYPQFFHLRGYQNEPVWYEKPPKVNLKALRGFGITLDEVVDHYALVTEFGWQYLEPNDFSQSITVIDLEGIRVTDFVGDVKGFVRKAASFTGQHYPERAGYVFVINVPSWFKLIWKVVKGFVDEATLQKISILRGKEEIFAALQSKIPVENIPPEYGGTSMPLGFSPEEYALSQFMEHNNQFAASHGTACAGPHGDPPCPFCVWMPVRNY